MNDNVFLETSNLNSDNLKFFARWLAQYESENKINRFFETNPELFADCEGMEDPAKLSAAASPDLTLPAPGQIRMLNASMTSDHEIITQILILSQWEGSQWLISPFSRFSVPATPGEISADEDFSAYKVLEVWNSTIVPEFLLCSNSVFLRTVSETFRKEACQLYFHLLAEDELPHSAAIKTGPPILSRLDPRIQYLLTEEEQLRPLHAEAERINRLFAGFAAAPQEDSILMAAGEAGKEAVFYTVEGAPAVIRCLVRDGQIKLKVFSPDRMNYSNVLDGWMVLLADGKVLGAVTNGNGLFPGIDKSRKQSIILADPDGSMHRLSKLE